MAWRFGPWIEHPLARLLALGLALWPAGSLERARADGAMVERGRVLFRVGAEERGYCDRSGDECDRVKTKVLSGYGYLRGYVSGGAALTGAAEGVRASGGLLDLEITFASGALPGGDLRLLGLGAVVGAGSRHRLRAALIDAEGLFMCTDADSGEQVAPVIGMFTRNCRPDAVLAFDASLLALHWDVATDRLAAEWIRAGPAVELLGNGFGYAHLLRSVMLALPLDLRSVHHGDRRGGTSVGAGLRLSAMLRTPHWEARLDARHRSTLAGHGGAFRDHGAEADLRLLHNFFLSDALVVQLGVSLRGAFLQRPRDSFVSWTDADRRWQGYAGLYLGWLREPPDI